MKKTIVSISFPNSKAAKHFVSWLCESGEQQYWDWMENIEQKVQGNVTAIDFDYDGLEINTTAGRLDRADIERTDEQ